MVGLQCNPPTNSKLGGYGRGNSKSQYVLISQISAFPNVSHNVVGLPGKKNLFKVGQKELDYKLNGKIAPPIWWLAIKGKMSLSLVV